MHKKEMRNWMFIISVFLLVACNEVVYLRNDEKPVLVLYAVLEAGCDSMRIELAETKGAYDQSPWQRFPEAEVRVYEEGELLGMAEYPEFSRGSARLALALAKNPQITSVIGGGDTADFVRSWDALKGGSFTHVSTGGGASLELMAGGTLPGIAALMPK